MIWYRTVPLTLVIFFCLASCVDSSKVNGGAEKGRPQYVIPIDRKDLEDIPDRKLSDLISWHEIVRLETNPECYIGSVKKVEYVNGLIIVLDSDSKHELCIFDVSGQFLRKIGKIGKGPYELNELYDFVYDTVKNEVLLLDGGLRKIISYDVLGTAREEISLPFYADHFEQVEGSLYCFLGSAFEDRILLWDIESKEQKGSYIPYDIKNSVSASKPFHRYQNAVMYTRELCDTILEVSGDGVKASRFIDFGRYRVKESDLASGLLGTLDAVGDNMTGVRYYCESDSMIYFAFDYDQLNPQSPYYVLYDKKSGEKIIYSNQSLTNDITSANIAPQILTVSADGTFIGVTPALQIVQSLGKYDEGKGSAGSNDDMSMLKKVRMTDNPVIVFYKFKELLNGGI